jgi:hypothetical protein
VLLKRILILSEKTPFREGLKKLLEYRFGDRVEILETEFQKIQRKNSNNDIPHLIIVESIPNIQIESYLFNMKQLGSKILLLTLEPSNLEDFSYQLFNGFLTKGMQTNELLQVIKGTLLHEKTYVHPDFGYFFFRKFTDLTKLTV